MSSGFQKFLTLLCLSQAVLAQEQVVVTNVSQGTDVFPVTFSPSDIAWGQRTTLDPYNLDMFLDYGPIDVFNEDITASKKEREDPYTGWYFRPRVSGATISLLEGEVVVMYVQIEDPAERNIYESFSCSAKYEGKNTSYVGGVVNYNYGALDLSNAAVTQDSMNV